MRKGQVRFSSLRLKLFISLYVLFLFFTLSAHGELNAEGKGSDLRFVLRDLAESAGVRILMDSSVAGTVTVKLRENIPVKTALELLAGTYGYSFKWVEDGRTIIVGNTEIFNQTENEETIVYQLNHINPDVFLTKLKSVLPKERIQIEQETKKVVITGNALEQANVVDLIEYYDRIRNHYVLDVLLEEVSVEAFEKIAHAGGSIDQGRGTGPSLHFNVIDLNTILGLQEQNHAGLLVNSRLMAVEGRENTIFFGDRYPVIFTRITEKGVEELINYKKVGIDLTVLPGAPEQNLITFNLRAEVHSISDWQRTAKGNDIPIITKTEGGSVRRLRIGEAFVLTGFNLIKEGDEGRVPPGLLGLPVIGKIIQARGQVTVENNFGEERMLCLILAPRIAGVDLQMKAYARGDNIDNKSMDPGTMVTTEIYSISGETVEREQTIPQFETEVEQVGEAEIQAKVEKENAEGEASLGGPAIKVVITDGTGSSPQNNNVPDIQQTEKNIGLHIPYSVKKGDTVYGVARKFGLDPKSILKANNLSSSSTLSVEQVLVLPIPADHLYQLKPQETIWRIAKRYGLDVELLLDINSLSDVTVLKAGQVIILPVSADRVTDPEY